MPAAASLAAPATRAIARASSDLEGERGVHDVGAGQAKVDVASVGLADRFVDCGEERDYIVVDLSLDILDTLDVEAGGADTG